VAVLDLDEVSPVTPGRFAVFRIALGTYLTVRFVQLVPCAAELFSGAGVLPDPGLNPTHGILPNPLALWDSPAFARGFTIALAAISILFAAGLCRRAAALALAVGSACLFNRNNLIDNPSIPFVGMLLLLCACVPPGEPLALSRPRGRENWFFPAWALRTAWIVMAAGYTVSGIDKLLASPSWRDGSALTHILELPLARPGPLRDLFLSLPETACNLATWAAVGLEASFLPLSLHPRGRQVAWAGTLGLQLGILALVSFTELTAGMLLLHAFTFDPRWVASLSRPPPHGGGT
jgi:hypothetical protein